MSGQLKYWRADNMWAAAGRPDGDLGEESISLQPGQTRVFVTDWKYEKRRNDGKNYSLMNFVVRSGMLRGILQTVKGGRLRLPPGQGLTIKNDIAEVLVPKL